MVNIAAKNTLAKLLAKEGITVQHGNYETAYFDVENRVLGLPVWKDMDNLYDLLVGHEVGHALFTPPEGWHSATQEIPGCPRQFVNIIEDIRIEKLVQRSYPGLVLSFKKGYTNLHNRDFFKIGGIVDILFSQFKLIDRINIKAKLRDIVKVEFSAEEKVLVNEAFAVETWEDVLAVCKKLVEYAKTEEKKNTPQPDESLEDFAQKMMASQSAPQSNDDNGEESETNDSNTQETSGSDNEEGQSSSDKNDSEESGQADSKTQTSEENGDAGKEETKTNSDDADDGVAGSNDSETEEQKLKSITDTAQRQSEKELVERDRHDNPMDIVYGLTDQQWNESVVSFKELAEERKKLEGFFGVWRKEEENHFNAFESETKRFVQIMAKEFELKKAAWRSKRAQTSRSGSLDVNKLYSYKYNDDIFKRFVSMPDAKNHGMVLLVDWSGSMHEDLGSVIKQVLSLTAFCKKVNIPFDVYSFTSKPNDRDGDNCKPPSIQHVKHHDVHVVHMLSSKMNKVEYSEAFRAYAKISWVFNAKGGYASGTVLTRLEQLGMTPLNAVLTYIPTLLKKFRQETGAQKIIFTCLTDGASQNADSVQSLGGYGGRKFIVNNKLLDTTNKLETEVLLENIKNYCENTVGYFLTRGSRHNFQYALPTFNSDKRMPWLEVMDLRKEFLKNKILHYKNTKGYGDYFILRSDKASLNTDNEDFAVSKVAKKAEITRAFKKFQKSKKGNRIMATKFAEAVA